MNKGWISLHRKIQDCDLWMSDEPFDRRSAWIDLLLSANHEEVSMIFDGHRMVIKRGQWLTSVRKLALRWNWGKDKTLNFLKLLEELEMIKRDADSRRTLLTIVNYDIYQSDASETQTVSRQLTDSKQTVSRHSSATNNNENNENNDNNENKNTRVRFTPPTLEEVEEYCIERCNGIDPQAFIDHYTSNGWMVGRNKMKDWRASVRTWERKRTQSTPRPNNNNSIDWENI